MKFRSLEMKKINILEEEILSEKEIYKLRLKKKLKIEKLSPGIEPG